MRPKFIIVFSFLLLSIVPMMCAQTYDKLWKEIEEAKKKSLPQTVIKLSEDIFRKAEAEKNSPQMLKAYTNRAMYQRQITPDSFYVDLNGLEKWADNTAKPIDRYILHTLISSVYADYASNNRWQLMRRTDVNDNPAEDIREWSGNMFVQKVLNHSKSALENPEALLNASTKDYQPFVVQGESSAYYHHDMYHMLVMYNIDALKKILNFNNDSIVYNAIDKHYDDLVETYTQKGNTDGLILATLDRLQWGNRRNSNNDDYIKKLDELINKYQSNDVIVEAYISKANELINKNNNKDALQMANDVVARYPKYKRINAMKEVKERILLPSLSINSESTVYPDSSISLQIQHRNLKTFTINIYKVNLPVTSRNLTDDVDVSGKRSYEKYGQRISTQKLTLTPDQAYLMKDTLLKIKAPSEGIYYMQIVPEGNAKNSDSKLFSVTRLKALSRKLPGNLLEIIVLDAQTGKPVKDAKVRLFEDRKGERVEVEQLTADENGKIQSDWNDNYFYFTVEKDNDTSTFLQRVNGGYYYYRDNDRGRATVKLLTDRALYRPGQTVYVKGIAYEQRKDTANVISGRNYTLTLTDTNGREVGKKELRTNEFGSFAAEFVLPTAGLNGTYFLRTDNGNASIQVEEYKRPTFDITFDPQAGSYRLDDSVDVKGIVKTYSGVNVQDLPVQYTVKRAFSNWWRIFYDEGTLISSGSAMLNDEGRFTIPVQLKSDPNNTDVEHGFYNFIIEATVTNEAGETQSSTLTLPVGSRSVMLSLQLPSLINKDDSIKATFKATNLSQQPVAVEGTYSIYPFTNYEKHEVSDKAIYSGTFVSNKETLLTAWKSIPSGAYRVKLTAKDDQGREVTFEAETILFSINDKRPPVEGAVWNYPINTEFDAAHPASFIFGTSKKDAYVFMDVFSGNKKIESRVLQMSDELMKFDYPYKKEYEDGVTITFLFVKEGLIMQDNVRLTKRLPEKDLKLSWEVFRDKLRPGQQEEWKLTIKTPQGVPADAELLATMYDASLDKIFKNNQSLKLMYNLSTPTVNWYSYDRGMNFYSFWFRQNSYLYSSMVYDSFWMTPSGLLFGNGGISVRGSVKSRAASGSVAKITNDLATVELDYQPVAFDQQLIEVESQEDTGEPIEARATTPDLRTNFSETAFFYPQLRTNKEGEVVLSFTMPESLTRWNFNGYAHTKGMLTGMIKSEVVTSKEFMLTPNLPRFVRVGDKTSLTASVANLTGKTVSGTVTLTLFDPITEKAISTQKQKFDAAAGKTAAVNFMFTATDKYDLLGCRIIAQGGNFSDGEQHLLPVLSNKENITETVAMPVRGKETRDFSLESLFNNNSKTAVNRRLTVEFSGNPAWYAIQALPSLSLPKDDNAVSWAATYYANSLASYIVNAQPRIKAVFDGWKQQGGTKETFMSNLQKNQDVKNILLEESPWLIEATSETEQMQRIATLFDLNNIRNNNMTALTKLKDLQLTDGSWTWYKGMPGSRYMTSFVVETLSRLAALTNNSLEGDALSMRNAALNFLHAKALQEYNEIQKAVKNGNQQKGISSTGLEYLYLIAVSGQQVPANNKTAYNYFLGKVRESITSLSLTQKAQAAVVLQKAGRTSEANAFMASLKEHTVQTDEQGMHFAFNESPYDWFGLKIPAHVAVMEAMYIVAKDTKSVEEMKLWLLKQKQTQQWGSPVSTVNAVYALLHRGNNLLENQGDVRISLGGKVLETLSSGNTSVPGLSYIKETITDNSTLSKTKKVTVEKKDEGIAWGAVYAQYQEDMDKVSRHAGELNVDKKLYVEKVSGNSKELVPLTQGIKLSVGDKVVSRLTIRVDRAMDFVQLKDQRGACFEPIGALSGYIWAGGIGYYVAVKDASTNFFFNSLGKGVYVLEYGYRVAREGTYEAGLAVIQSAYAPEYASHSSSVKVEIGK